MRRALDPAVVEAVRHGSLAIAEEMRFDLMRAARSPVLREAGDLSCALTDAGGRTVAQGNDIPMHLGVMGFTVRSMLERRHPELRPGDVLFVNHPEIGGNHLPDVKALRPVFDGDRLWAFAVALAHWPDVGGALPGSYVPHARDLQQEGLVLPPLRLFDAAGEVADAMELVLANVRGGEERRDRHPRASGRDGDRRAAAVRSWRRSTASTPSSRAGGSSRTSRSSGCGARWRPFPTASTTARTRSTTTAPALSRSRSAAG